MLDLYAKTLGHMQFYSYLIKIGNLKLKEYVEELDIKFDIESSTVVKEIADEVSESGFGEFSRSARQSTWEQDLWMFTINNYNRNYFFKKFNAMIDIEELKAEPVSKLIFQ